MLRSRALRYVWLAGGLGVVVVLFACLAWNCIGTGRVLKLGTAYPTETKPQSKLWHAHGRWWAWLPDANGSSVWERDKGRWIRDASLDAWLSQVPGHADVWSDDDGVCAVVVGTSQLTLARLRFNEELDGYEPDGDPVIWPTNESTPRTTARWRSQLADSALQCATISRDSEGLWWLAYDFAGRIWVRRSVDPTAAHWDEPVTISDELTGDDLCAIFSLRDGVGVVWTDQARNSILFRHRPRNSSENQWSEIETIAHGDRVANNHLHAAVAGDGTAYIVSKSALYTPGEPMLSLHIRMPDGRWTSTPYANFNKEHTPTRPIAVLTPDDTGLWLVNALLDNSRLNSHSVEARLVRVIDASPPKDPVSVISPHLDLQNPTACKNRLPADGPWIVLGSDRFGNVFEGFLPKPSE